MIMRIIVIIMLVLAAIELNSAQGGLEQKENAELAQWPANVHRCVHTTNKVRKRGDGSTVGSCSSCDPATDECEAGCQDLINQCIGPAQRCVCQMATTSTLTRCLAAVGRTTKLL